MVDRAYRAAPSEALRIEALGELTAIFDRRSMQTHLVVQPVPEILDAMQADRCDAALVAERLAALFDIDHGDDTMRLIAERLAELAEMGLVAEA